MHKKFQELLHRYKLDVFHAEHDKTQRRRHHQGVPARHRGVLEQKYHYHFHKLPDANRAEIINMINNYTREAILPPVVETHRQAPDPPRARFEALLRPDPGAARAALRPTPPSAARRSPARLRDGARGDPARPRRGGRPGTSVRALAGARRARAPRPCSMRWPRSTSSAWPSSRGLAARGRPLRRRARSAPPELFPLVARRRPRARARVPPARRGRRAARRGPRRLPARRRRPGLAPGLRRAQGRLPRSGRSAGCTLFEYPRAPPARGAGGATAAARPGT